MITIPETGIAAQPRPRSGMAAFLPVGAPAAKSAALRVCARPSNEKSARTDQRHAVLAFRGQAAMQLAGLVPTYMTRINAASALTGTAGGGAVGPHPPREPEPV